MKNNSFGKLAVMVAMTFGLLAGTTSRASAQILRLPPLPPGGFTIRLPDPNDLMDITAGAFHTCVRKYSGAVYCWGLNGWNTSTGGQVGVTSTTASCKDSPIQDPMHISVGPATYSPCVDRPTYVTTASQVVAGLYHTCALNQGVASCWGSNLFGALGDNTQTDHSTPRNVNTSVSFTRLAAGDSLTCGLSGSGIYCWGYLPYDGTSTSSSLTPKQLSTYNGFNSLTVGSRFACFVYNVGSYGENDCQGIDNVGQLGVVNMVGSPSAPSWLPRDSNNIPFAPFIVGTSMGSGNVIRSSAGYAYVCGDLTNGNVQCMGSNSNGQLGTSGGDRADAQAVVNGAGSAMQLHGVTTGSAHACALDANGSAWCWGSGQYGELGNNSTGFGLNWKYAVQVMAGTTFRSLAAGDRHTCGIGTDNRVYCWGDNEYGQLGVGYNNLGFSGFSYRTYIGTPQQVPVF